MRQTWHSIAGLFEVALWRDGGQRQARRNAWAAMVADAGRARARAEADAAVRDSQPVRESRPVHDSQPVLVAASH